MSYSETTTHFNWPLPTETDLFNGLDDNQMKEDLDEKIYNLEQQSTGDHEAVTQLNSRVTEVEQTVSGYDTQIEELEGTVGEHAERLINLTNRQTELSRRLNGKAGESTIAAEYNEEESYLVGDFVYYANILYKCTVASATPAGAFDSDNWDIAILTDELGGSTPTPGSIAAANVTFDDVAAQLGASNVQAAIVALKTLIDNMGGSNMKVIAEGFLSTATAKNETVTFPSEYSTLAPEDYMVILSGGVASDSTGSAAGGPTGLAIKSKNTGSVVLGVPTNGGGYYQIVSLIGQFINRCES